MFIIYEYSEKEKNVRIYSFDNFSIYVVANYAIKKKHYILRLPVHNQESEGASAELEITRNFANLDFYAKFRQYHNSQNYRNFNGKSWRIKSK